MTTPYHRDDDDKPLKQARRAAILSAARAIFLAEGFAGTSMSRIASEVGGSKATLYSYFQSKEDLFRAILHSESVADSLDADGICLECGATSAIEELSRRVVDEFVCQKSIEIFRLVVGESVRFPELVHWYYEEGFLKTRAVVAAFLARLVTRGMLRSCDPVQAAGVLLSMIRSATFQQILLLGEKPSINLVKAHVQAVAGAFIEGHAIRYVGEKPRHDRGAT